MGVGAENRATSDLRHSRRVSAPPRRTCASRRMMTDLGLPLREAHNAPDDAVMAGLAFVKLRYLASRHG